MCHIWQGKDELRGQKVCGTNGVERMLDGEFGGGLVGQEGIGVWRERLRAARWWNDGVGGKCGPGCRVSVRGEKATQRQRRTAR